MTFTNEQEQSLQRVSGSAQAHLEAQRPFKAAKQQDAREATQELAGATLRSTRGLAYPAAFYRLTELIGPRKRPVLAAREERLRAYGLITRSRREP